MASEKILYVGDSHSYGEFGKVMAETLNLLSDEYVLYASCGSSPATWISDGKYAQTVCGFWQKSKTQDLRFNKHKTPRFGEEILKLKPSIVIIQLGTNIAAMSIPQSSEQAIREMMRISIENGARCLWIGPPDAHSKVVTDEKLKITNELIKNIAQSSGCSYVDSLLMTHFPKESREGIHYPPSASREWGEKVSQQLKSLIMQN